MLNLSMIDPPEWPWPIMIILYLDSPVRFHLVTSQMALWLKGSQGKSMEVPIFAAEMFHPIPIT